MSSARKRGSWAVGAGFTFAALIFFVYMLTSTPSEAPIAARVRSPGNAVTTAPSRPSIEDAGEMQRAPSEAEASTAALDAAAQQILSTQTEGKRNQILVIDAYRQILDRYPDIREQRSWFQPTGTGAEALAQLRAKGATETAVANLIAATLMEAPAFADRVPKLTSTPPAPAPTSASDPTRAATVAAAMVARSVHYRDDIPRRQDEALVQRLRVDSRVSPDNTQQVATMVRLLRGITGSTDIGEHFIEDENDDGLELDAMRTLLRQGKLLVLNGNDGAGPARYLVVYGFDREGNFGVRDPAGKMPDKIAPIFVSAFLRKPSAMGDTSGAGFWLDVPGTRTRVRCVPKATLAVRNSAPAVPAPPVLILPTSTGFTGVIPGAQINLTSLRIPPGEHSLRGTLTLTAEHIDAILRAVGSPAVGYGKDFVQWGRYYNVDPAYALAFFQHESWMGTHHKWVGRKPNGDVTKNIGNIRYVGRPNPQRVPQYGEFHGFRDYTSWTDGIHDWFKLIAQDAHYAGIHTVERILPKYAPVTENDTAQYMRDVVSFVMQWRTKYGAQVAAAQAAPSSETASTPEPEVECK